jgi:hypothetical protein
MSVRPEEQFCQNSFDAYLRAPERGIAPAWREPERDPPDLLLTVSGRLYAVEVTALMTQYEDAEGRSLSELGLWKGTAHLAAGIEREARGWGVLRGSYVLTLDGPYQDWRRSLTEIRAAALRFITETRDDDPSPPPDPAVPLSWSTTQAGQRFSIQKTGLRGDGVDIVILGDGSAWGWEIAEELHRLAEGATASKGHKLRDVPPPWVLLLLDEQHMALEREYQEVGRRLAGAGDNDPVRKFHSVYIVNRSGAVYCFYPEAEPAWGP